MNKKAEIDINQLTEAGLFFGHKTSATHPKMRPYISGEKNSIHIINLEKTKKCFEKTLEEIKKIISDGKTLLLVGTKIQAKEIIKEVAVDCGLPYVNERWLGGTITNFSVIKKRVDYYKQLEKRKESGELEKYTKKEKLEIDRELERLRIKFEGIKNLEKTPDAVFVLDIKKDITAIKEAKRKNILVFGVVDTNDNPDLVDYFIPANNDAISSIRYILNKIKEVIYDSNRTNKKT